MNNFDMQESIDASRLDPNQPEVTYIQLHWAPPTTSPLSGKAPLKYPATLVVKCGEGRLPSFIAPFFRGEMPALRRIQNRSDPDFGFVTDNYTCFGSDAYVARQPGDSTELQKHILASAEKAGWKHSMWGVAPASHIDLYKPLFMRPETPT